jgi:uncharacterized DUF497 family protein
MAGPGLDRDEGNRTKCQKHGVRLDEIESFFQRQPRYSPDLAHSALEHRFIAIGQTAAGRPLFVVFTFRERDGQRLIRPISARYMHAKEARRYAEEGSGSED